MIYFYNFSFLIKYSNFYNDFFNLKMQNLKNNKIISSNENYFTALLKNCFFKFTEKQKKYFFKLLFL